jgi:hypothetical protein
MKRNNFLTLMPGQAKKSLSTPGTNLKKLYFNSDIEIVGFVMPPQHLAKCSSRTIYKL